MCFHEHNLLFNLILMYKYMVYNRHSKSNKNNKIKYTTKKRQNKSKRKKCTRVKNKYRRMKRTRRGGITNQLSSKNAQNMVDSFMSNDPRYIAAKYAMNQSNEIASRTLNNTNKSDLIGSTLNASNILNASKLSSSGVPAYHNQYSTTSISTQLPTTLNGTS